MTSYRTIRQRASEILVIKKSKFIGQALPVSSEDEAQALLQDIRKEHWDATHNCFAYVIGLQSELQKASDAGEPSGTVGRPMLDVLLKEEVTNVLVVVTRYYGGILLGAGGLVRAYSGACHDALHAAGIVTRSLFRRVQLSFDYAWLGTLEHYVHVEKIRVEPIIYSDRVQMVVQIADLHAPSFAEKVADLTSGQAEVELLDSVYGDET